MEALRECFWVSVTFRSQLGGHVPASLGMEGRPSWSSRHSKSGERFACPYPPWEFKRKRQVMLLYGSVGCPQDTADAGGREQDTARLPAVGTLLRLPCQVLGLGCQWLQHPAGLFARGGSRESSQHPVALIPVSDSDQQGAVYPLPMCCQVSQPAVVTLL